MRIHEAVSFCEEHECIECPVYINDEDKRTRDEILRHVPCCINLTDEYLERE